MTVIKAGDGEIYTPAGHDSTVVSRKLFNPLNGSTALDVHVTTFSPGAGMDEESHEDSAHVFYMLSGCLELLAAGAVLGNLEAGDAVFIPAREVHQLRNPGPGDGVFIAITTIAGP